MLSVRTCLRQISPFGEMPPSNAAFMGLSIKLADVVLLQIGKKFQMCHSLCLMSTVNLSRVQMSFCWLVGFESTSSQSGKNPVEGAPRRALGTRIVAHGSRANGEPSPICPDKYIATRRYQMTGCVLKESSDCLQCFVVSLRCRKSFPAKRKALFFLDCACSWRQ